MQDLGGCRAVLPSMRAVRELVELHRAGRDEHEFVKESDYIGQPKTNGYRSLHRVYRYRSRATRNAAWDGHRIEIQIRSHLQHAWATAVETVDAIKGTQLKTSGPANGAWDRFFTLMGSVLAIEEGCPPVPGTPVALSEIREEVRKLVRELDVEGHPLRPGRSPTGNAAPAGHRLVLMRLECPGPQGVRRELRPPAVLPPLRPTTSTSKRSTKASPESRRACSRRTRPKL